MPLIELGQYASDTWIGPAYWVRCVVDGGIALPGEGTPVVYLPGYARSDIRAVDDAHPELKPLAELQYRGTTFSQKSGRDWTLLAFLQASETRGGLGIEVASDEATKAALLRAFDRVLTESVERLRRTAPLKSRHFDEIMTPDIDRDVLRWLDDPLTFRVVHTDEEWDSFRGRFAERFNMDLTDGEILVARALGSHTDGPWVQVWQAFADAPDRYPRIEGRLRAARPKRKHASEQEALWDDRGRWPQDRDAAEAAIRDTLVSAADESAEQARDRLLTVEPEAAVQRRWVWARNGGAPLAAAMEHVARLATVTSTNLPPADLPAIIDDYTSRAWRADDAAMRAMAAVDVEADAAVVGSAVRAIYKPWLEVAAERMASAVADDPSAYRSPPLPDWPVGTCLLFTDGLRFDLGLRLADLLGRAGTEVRVEPRLTALPTITPTAKPSVTPAAARLRPGSVFGVRSRTGAVDLSAESLRREIRELGFQTLDPSDTGDPSGRAWGEQGDIDALGHEHQARLPALIDSEISKLAARIRALLAAGWSQVVVVTDHGWLYLPGGLPKADLPLQATKDGGSRKGRAARLADGAITDVQVVPWHWDPAVRIALAPGIRSFVGSPVYEHGGVSPQECVTPVVIARQSGAGAKPVDVRVVWAGLRARLEVSGAKAGWAADVRRAPGDPGSSIVGGKRLLDDQGRAAFPVEDDELQETDAYAVVLGADESVVAQVATIVGGEI